VVNRSQTFAITVAHRAAFDAFGWHRPMGLYHGTAANLMGISWNEFSGRKLIIINSEGEFLEQKVSYVDHASQST
jgi:hypothetical protein